MQDKGGYFMKPDSREVLSLQQDDPTELHGPAGGTWQVTACMRSLGHVLQHNGFASACQDATSKWKALWANY